MKRREKMEKERNQTKKRIFLSSLFSLKEKKIEPIREQILSGKWTESILTLYLEIKQVRKDEKKKYEIKN